MRVLGFVNNNGGPGYHRILAPLQLMDGADTLVTNSKESVMEYFEKGCDILIYNRLMQDVDIELLNEWKAKYGFKVCVDVDDYWELDEHHVLYKDYQETLFAERQISHLRNADFVLTTHSRLAKEIEPFNAKVHVCANAIPHAGQFDLKKEPYYLTRLFWQGSVTHRPDIELLEGPINALAKISGDIKMVMAGYQEQEPEWHAMAHIYTAGFKHQYKIIPGMHVKEYYAAYQDADICLIPLINSRFNRHKSNLKVLEAANLGLPVVASAVHPYLELPIMYCRHSNDWISHITKLVKSKKRQRDAGYELKEFCDKNFNFKKINKERKQILEYYASKINA